MFKIILTSFCLISSCLIAYENSSTESSSQRGRYQFKTDKRGYYIYLLDTETGRMWMTDKPCNGQVYPWVQLPPLPTAVESWVQLPLSPTTVE